MQRRANRGSLWEPRTASAEAEPNYRGGISISIERDRPRKGGSHRLQHGCARIRTALANGPLAFPHEHEEL